MVIRDPSAEIELSSLQQQEAASHLASPLHRFAAFVVDYYIIVWPILLLVVSPFVRSMKLSIMMGDEYDSEISLITTYFIGWIFILLYQAVCISIWGATPGMRILNIRVARIWNSNLSPSFVGSLARAFFWSIGFVFCGVPFLGIFADPHRRAFHDRVLNTIVVTTRSRRAVLPPTVKEMTLARLATWLFVGTVLVSFVSTLALEARKTDLKSKITVVKKKTDKTAVCEGLDEAYQNWPQENGQYASKLSVAMALYAAEQIERECLEIEARNPFLEEKDIPLSYLAKSFIHSDEQELSDLYLEQVCQESDKQNEDCILAEVIEAMSNEDYITIDQKFSELSPDGRVYSKVWALRQYLREERYEEAEDYLNNLPDDVTLGHFSAPARAKILWGTKKQEAARMVAMTAFETLPGKDKANLSSWMCFEEMSQNCDQSVERSCQIFSRATEKDDRLGRELLPALTLFKMAECSEDKNKSYENLLQERLHPEVKRLAQMTIENDEEGLRKIVTHAPPFEEVESEVVDEAALVLADTTKNDSDMSLIQNMWQEKAYGLRWEQIGLKLFSFWQSKKDWLQAVKIGEKLAPTLRDEEFLQEYAVTLSKAGMQKEALSLVADIESINSKGQTNREPASQDDYENLRKQLEDQEK